ncbi:SDR family oxidoreductase [Candidatus Pacearchaeota archaeon]|nr:SDR family oxidoreductase [Candidatus Pacearchaeota archaeon]
MLKGKIAIVTGGAKGIGKSIADKLIKEGAKVVVLDIEKAKTKYSEICDVSKFDDVQKIISRVGKKFGRIDILVNNAGIYPFQNLAEMAEEEWDRVIDIDLKSVFNCTRAVLDFMKKGGKIVNITSIAGSRIGFSGLTHYCAAKSGIVGFTRAAALELAPKKINVNAIAPGLIITPGVTSGLDKKGIESTVGMVPLKRAGQPEDIADAAVFLASSGADYITGETIAVDGGWTVS